MVCIKLWTGAYGPSEPGLMLTWFVFDWFWDLLLSASLALSLFFSSAQKFNMLCLGLCMFKDRPSCCVAQRALILARFRARGTIGRCSELDSGHVTIEKDSRNGKVKT